MWQARTPRDRLVADSVLALALLVIAEIEVWAPSILSPESMPGPKWAVSISQAVVCGAVAFRRVRPFVALSVATAAQLLEAAAYGSNQGLGSFLPFAILVYSVGAYEDRPNALAGLGLTVVGASAHELLDPLRDEGGLTDTLPYYVVILMLWGTGRIVARQRALDHDRAVLRERTEQDRRAWEEEAVRSERARIARELHDVVSHTLGVVAVQAEAAADVIVEDPSAAMSALENIQRKAREGLADMRRMVGVLQPRSGDELEPQPCVDRIESLVDDVRTAGLEVELRIDGASSDVPPGVGVSVYRIVQESLTNALRHADASHASVAVTIGDQVDIVVTDDGHGSSDQESASGRGLIGMKERVSLAGGELDIGSVNGGGFRVHAVIPLEERP